MEPMISLEVTAAVIRREGRVLICQRPEGKSCGLLWEFPGGKIEPGETGEQCIVRECQEELGVMLRVERQLTQVTHEYPGRTVHLRFYLCAIEEGTLERKEHHALAWIAPEEIGQYDFCPADRKMLASVPLEALFQ